MTSHPTSARILRRHDTSLRVLRLAAGLLCLFAPAFAVDWKALKPQGYVSDFAGVVDDARKTELEVYAAEVKQSTGAELAFVTVQSLEGEPIEDVANDIFHAWGIGQKGEDNGAMVLLAIGDRKSRLEVGGGLGEAIPDGMAGLLLDDMRPALRQGLYGAAFVAAAERLGDAIAKAKGVKIEPIPPAYFVQPETRDFVPAFVPIFFFGIFFLIFGLVVVGRLRGWNRASAGRRGGVWVSGGGGDSGGGFGGFDSSSSDGGFDGFSGGDSGGGGASSDW